MPSSSPASLDLEAQSDRDTCVVHVTVELHDHDRPGSPSGTHGPPVAPRLTSEFRTLSIHVETRTSPEGGAPADVSGAIRTKAVKG